eukprot:Rmarinus@m.2974
MKRLERRKVSVTFGSPGTCHHSEVQSLACKTEKGCGSRFFSASRDCTIRQWDTSKSAQQVQLLDHHTDWVNDICLIGNDRIASASSDKTVKLWDTNCSKDNPLLYTFKKHVDYVTALAFANETSLLVSASLDNSICLWDLNKAAHVASDSVVQGSDKASLYCVGTNFAGTVIVSGSSESVVRVWDPRSASKRLKLRGHMDVVRAVVVSSDGSKCLTGGSDATIRLWDIGQQRCIHSFDVHSDSVWALISDPSFSRVISGGRDGMVAATNLKTCSTLCLCSEGDKSPIFDVCLDSHEEMLWVARPGAIKGYNVKQALQVDSGVTIATPRVVGESYESENISLSSCVKTPSYIIRGLPAIRRYEILNNRRHVLTEDSSGMVELWDITKGNVVKSYGDADFEETVKALFEPVHVQSWFSIDIKSGGIVLHMKEREISAAEGWPSDLGILAVEKPPVQDVMVNIGEHFLRSLFSEWRDSAKKRPSLQTNVSSDSQEGGSGTEVCDTKTFHDISVPSKNASETSRKRMPDYLKPFPLAKDLSVFISDDRNGDVYCKLRACDFTGSKQEVELLPWVGAILRGETLAVEGPKVTFALCSMSRHIPEIPQQKLNTPPGTTIGKVLQYVKKELLKLKVEAISEDTDFEILCKDEIVPLRMTIASVRRFLWKDGGELRLYYRIRSPGSD